MASHLLTSAITAIAYGVVAWWLFWIVFSYRKLGPSLVGVAVHLLIVAIRTTIIVLVPGADMWDWSNIHRLTICIAALCALLGGWRLWGQA